MNKQLPGWTDYPITEFGDPPNEPAPLRSCIIIDYDGDKMIKIVVCQQLKDGHAEMIIKEIKRVYVYKTNSRAGFPYSHPECYNLFNRPEIKLEIGQIWKTQTVSRAIVDLTEQYVITKVLVDGRRHPHGEDLAAWTRENFIGKNGRLVIQQQ